MKRIPMRLLFLVCILFSQAGLRAQPAAPSAGKYVLVIHGGAGTILKSQMTPQKEAAYTAALTEALQKGYDTLEKGGTALDAVEAAVKILEDCPLFNAGKGAVFTAHGVNELDAAMMNGQTLAAGSVAGVTTVRNPVTAARAVMEKSNHVLLTGKGAEIFARQAGCTIVKPSYFYTKERWEGLQKARKADSLEQLKQAVPKKMSAILQSLEQSGFYPVGWDSAALVQQYQRLLDDQIAAVWQGDRKFGTVGAVALDKSGNLAAATSTGGMTNKKWGRVGDAPIIGAGTYANNATCAISCTGWGEYFIRLVMAKTISDLMEMKGLSLQDAAEEMVMKKLPALGGDGGLVGLDRQGNMTMTFCTSGMYRGAITADGKIEVAIYK